MMDYKDGFKAGCSNIDAIVSSNDANVYINTIQSEINKLADDLNKFNGYQTGNSILGGDIAEFWHSGTFNIEAALEKSKSRTTVD